MPELPDLDILADMAHAALVGRPLAASAVVQPLVMRGTSAELAALDGQVVTSVRRRGKFLAFQLERDLVVMNLMLTGRLGLALPGANAWPQTALVLTIGSRDGPPPDAAVWTRAGGWLPGDDGHVELRDRDATRMGKVYLVPDGIQRRIAGWDDMGPDADDPALTLEVWEERISRHRGELKNLLRDQTFVSGIGNGYSDEILWEARLAPSRKRTSLAGDEVDALYAALRTVTA